MTETEQNLRRKQKLIRRIRRDCILKVLAAACAVVCVFSFVVGVTTAKTTQLAPAIQAGDVLVYLRIGHPVNGDVILFDAHAGAGVGKGNEALPDATTGADVGNGLRIARIRTTAGVMPSQKEDGLPTLESEAPGELRGTVFTIIRRRPL